MPPSPRYTVRLPPALEAQVQARVRAGTPVATLIREALSAYLAALPAPGTMTPAASADSVHALGEELAILRRRVEALEQVLANHRYSADTMPTGANSAAATAPPPADSTVDARLLRLPVGQFKLTARQVRALRAKRTRGVPIKALMEEFDISKATLFRYLQ